MKTYIFLACFIFCHPSIIASSSPEDLCQQNEERPVTDFLQRWQKHLISVPEKAVAAWQDLQAFSQTTKKNLITAATQPLNDTLQKNIITCTGGVILIIGIYNTSYKERRSAGVCQAVLGAGIMYSADPLIRKINQW